MKGLLAVLAVVVVLAVSGLAHDSACPAIASRSACKSFQQMRAAKDADIVETLANKMAFVCLSPKKDRFVTVAFDTPDWSDWLPDRDTKGNLYVEDWASGVDVSLHARGEATVQFFEDGISDQTFRFYDNQDQKAWRAMHAHYVNKKPVISASDLSFGAHCGGDGVVCDLTMDQAEIQMMENISGNHTVIIRRSTRRFFETVGNETVIGQCLEFRKPKGSGSKKP
jgi:hypothetical protein